MINKAFKGLLLLTVFVTLCATSALFIGYVNVGADSSHTPFVEKLIEVVRESSISRHAQSIDAPIDLDEPQRIKRGAGNYEAMCADCHLSPVALSSEMGVGLYPKPPSLMQASQRVSSEQFWIIKHGIMASGMPAWGKGGMSDQDIWDIVAFLSKLPSLDAASYKRIVASSSGHVHSGQNSHQHGKHPH